jgi:hypothetical protein
MVAMLYEEFLHLTKTELKKVFEDVEIWFSKMEQIQKYKPYSGGWSVEQILEHISLTNHYLLIIINRAKEKSIKMPRVSNSLGYSYEPNVLGKLDEVSVRDAFSWARPVHMEPKGEKPLEEVKTMIREQVEKCLEILKVLKNGEGLDRKITMSVHQIGKIDVYQYIYFLVMHAKRHIAQMEKNEKEYHETHTK